MRSPNGYSLSLGLAALACAQTIDSLTGGDASLTERQPPGMHKSTVDEIRRRFDADVDRFSNLDTGQSATIDAPLTFQLELLQAVGFRTVEILHKNSVFAAFGAIK